MQDNVYYVREASIKCLTDVLVKYQDDPNIENKIFQFLEKLKLSTSTFHQRNSYSLLLLSIVKNKNSSEALINNFLLPIAIENIATDRVGSIRCIGAQIILNIININKKFYSTKVKICLSTLAKDNDPDVKALIQKSL